MSKYVCRLSLLALLILAGFAALPMSERMAHVQGHAPELPRHCMV